jgi:hypothetical protein
LLKIYSLSQDYADKNKEKQTPEMESGRREARAQPKGTNMKKNEKNRDTVSTGDEEERRREEEEEEEVDCRPKIRRLRVTGKVAIGD